MDYNRLAAVARRLIQQNGAPMLFHRLGKPSLGTPKPWEGQPQGAVIEQTVEIPAVVVSPSAMLGLRATFEDTLPRYEQYIIVTPEQNAAYELLDCQQIQVPGGDLYKVGWSERLRPATVTLLYYFGVNR